MLGKLRKGSDRGSRSNAENPHMLVERAEPFRVDSLPQGLCEQSLFLVLKHVHQGTDMWCDLYMKLIAFLDGHLGLLDEANTGWSAGNDDGSYW